MASLSDDKEFEIVQAFNSTSTYLDAHFNMDIPYSKCLRGRIYPPELQLNKANATDTIAPF